MEISIVVPTRNEAGNIRPLLQRISQATAGIPCEVIFIDDSTDDTPAVIRRAKEECPMPVLLEHREKNGGLASAAARGFELANGRFLAVMDADLQHPPEILRSMYSAVLKGADLCAPSRFLPGGGGGNQKGVRRFISFSARWMGKAMIPRIRRMTDPTGGLFLFRRDLLKETRLQPVGWKILIEIVAVCPCRRIVEIPYEFQGRNSGESKISLRVTAEYIRQLLSLRRRSRRDRVEVKAWDPEEVRKSLTELEGRLHETKTA